MLLPKNGSKRLASFTPEKCKTTKKIRTSQPEEKTKNVVNTEDDNAWSIVERKKRNRNNNKGNKNFIKGKCETVTINAGGSSYADILKEMKNTIKPDKIGVGIKKIRKTNDGNVLIEMTKGEGQARKLESAIKESFGNNLEVQTVVEKYLLDIRDMEETTDEGEITNAILRATGETGYDRIKVRNIRDFYGGTKQALVEVPRNIAVTLLRRNRVKVGLVLCRVRRKIFAKRCFRCLEQGHIVRDCRGKDRRQTCMKCGIDGHKLNGCKNDPRCLICLEAGRQDVNHFIGASSSCSYKNGN